MVGLKAGATRFARHVSMVVRRNRISEESPRRFVCTHTHTLTQDGTGYRALLAAFTTPARCARARIGVEPSNRAY